MDEETIKLYKAEIALLQTEVRLQNERFEEVRKAFQDEREIKVQLIHDISKLREERKEIIRLANSICSSIRNSDVSSPVIFSTVVDYEMFVDKPLY